MKDRLMNRKVALTTFWLVLLMALVIVGPIQSRPVHAAPVAPAAIDLEHGPERAYLAVNGHLLIDQPGMRLALPQFSSDGRRLAVTLLPTGAEVERLAQTYVFDAETGNQLALAPGYAPAWLDGSQFLQLQDNTDFIIYDLATSAMTRTAAIGIDAAALPPLPFTMRGGPQGAQLAAPHYPATVRVAHHPSNTCRQVPAGQVDVIPFEEYVARVVPSEMPVSWGFNALAAQAVAARTYAWRHILAAKPDFDVSDWANYQVMCDARYSASDEAVAATAGQYLTEANDPSAWPISAMYSAENGHPTLTNPNVTYLQAVPDLFALGQVRFGHGYGLSQWGARWRARAGHNYRQILGHYYSNVHLQNALILDGAIEDLITPLPGDFITTHSLRWRTLTPLVSRGLTLTLASSVDAFAPVSLSADAGVWRPPIALPEDSALRAELWTENLRLYTVTLPVDTAPPLPPNLTAPALITGSRLPLTVDAAPETLVGLGQGWNWEGEELRYTPNSGGVVADPAAHNGSAWSAQVGVHQSGGVWFGPYTTSLAPGRSYRAIFWLRAAVQQSAAPTDFQPALKAARLDVTDHGGETILGLRDIFASDFLTATAYQPIPVDFFLFQPPQGLEFRVVWSGAFDLALDRIQILTLPDTTWQTKPLLWQFYGGAGEQRMEAAAFDAAGNMSAVMSQTVQIIDEEPPQMASLIAPGGWLSTTTMHVATHITDTLSGLAVTSGVLQMGALVSNATLSAPEHPWISQILSGTIEIAFEGVYTATLGMTDLAGNLAQTQFTIRVDRTPPIVTATTPITPVGNWYLAPVTVSLTAEDGHSGIQTLWMFSEDGQAAVYHQPLTWATPGVHQLQFWAVDRAGNRAAPQWFTATLDLASPVVELATIPLGLGVQQILWQAMDDAAGVAQVEIEVHRGDEVWAPHHSSPIAAESGVLQVSLEKEGSGAVRIRATDKAGRIGDWKERQFTLAGNNVYLPVARSGQLVLLGD
jgi:hypothetical protein